MKKLYYQSARGVYFDIEYSHFKYTTHNMTFVFTSEYNLQRFKDRYQNEIIEFNKKIANIYKNNHHLRFDTLALVRLYEHIEKRGFLIIYKNERVTCPNNITHVTKLEIS